MSSMNGTNGKRAFAGFKGLLVGDLEGLHLETEIRFGKLDVPEEFQANVISRDTAGRLVKLTSLFEGKPVQTTKGYVTAETPDPEFVAKEDVRFFQLIEGKEQEVVPFDRTKRFEIFKTVPASKVHEYVLESEYEVWAEDASGLYRLAKILAEKEEAAVTKLSFGGFKESVAFLQPLFVNGTKFVFIMSLTRFKKMSGLKHVIEIVPGMEQIKMKAKAATGPTVRVATVEV